MARGFPHPPATTSAPLSPVPGNTGKCSRRRRWRSSLPPRASIWSTILGPSKIFDVSRIENGSCVPRRQRRPRPLAGRHHEAGTHCSTRRLLPRRPSDRGDGLRRGPPGGANRAWGVDRFRLPGFALVCSVLPERQVLPRGTPARQCWHESCGGDQCGRASRGHADRALPAVTGSRARSLHGHILLLGGVCVLAAATIQTTGPRGCVERSRILKTHCRSSNREPLRTSATGYRESTAPRVLVVGAGTRFLSAMSYYTIRLTNALAGQFSVAVVPMRQLIPTFLYPGRSRVGSTSTRLRYDPAVQVLQGIDWFWVPNLSRDLSSLRRFRPDFVIFEWWTGTVLHTYLVIALMARLQGAHVIVEFHEVLDSGEERIRIARAWVRTLGRPFFRLASAFVIHSEADREPLEKRYRLRARPCVAIPHGPLDHHASRHPNNGPAPLVRRTAPRRHAQSPILRHHSSLQRTRRSRPRHSISSTTRK